MSSGKILKEYVCPYCGSQYRDRDWTFDHVIPREIGGPKKFKIIACRECNGRISREIEQAAMGITHLRELLCDLIQDGHKINSRRKRRGSFETHKGYGLSGGRKVKMMRNMETGELELVFLDNLGPPQTRQAIIPAENDRVPPDCFLKLVNKVTIGTMVWLWGDEVAETKGVEELRGRMWNPINPDTLLTLSESERHLAIKLESDADGENSNVIGQDALDNRPNHSICIFREENIVFSLVNFFGELESMDWVIDDALAARIPDNDGIVLIAKTTENSIIRMSLDEYQAYMSRMLGKPLSFACEVPFSRGN
jgi:hypothetical protein